MNNTTDLKSFNYLEDGKITFSMLNTVKTVKLLDPGFYSIKKIEDFRQSEIILMNEKINETHNLINYHFIPQIEEIYNCFFNEDIKKQVNLLNYNHKLGLLLFGKQGTAKSSILKYFYSKAIKEHNSIVFYFSAKNHFIELWDFISKIRKIQTNPIIIFLDEFDEFFTEAKLEETFKILMDGHLSIDNCMFLAATNYIDKIPETIKNRPSRIKYLIEVEGLQDEVLVSNFLKENFLKLNLTITDEEFNKILKKSIGKTVDELKEIVLDIIMNIKNEKTTKKGKLGF